MFRCLLMVLCLSAMVLRAEESSISRKPFVWKALWARKLKNDKEAAALVALAKRMKCNVLMIATAGIKANYQSDILPVDKSVAPGTLERAIELAHKDGIKVHAWMVNLRVSTEFAKKHPELLQAVRPEEKSAISKPRLDPGRANVHGGYWLNPDIGLTDHEKSVINEILSKFKFDGLALDYVGYKNYYASFSEFSNKKRREFAKNHPALTYLQVLTRFSENSLINYVSQVRETAEKIKPDIKLSIHIYPDFDTDPTYGCKLAVDYCGQTIAWFYKPFWSLDKIRDLCLMYKTAEKRKTHKYNHFVPFIGVYSRMLKSPERLRSEIRIARMADNGTIMFAFAKTFAEHPELLKVVAEEMGK